MRPLRSRPRRSQFGDGGSGGVYAICPRRSIPAYAGLRCAERAHVRGRSPRVRGGLSRSIMVCMWSIPALAGDTRGTALCASLDYGSTPRGRGNLPSSPLGSNPACAGIQAITPGPPRVYPRTRGEVSRRSGFARRFTPACAGPTTARSSTTVQTGVYSRTCGAEEIEIEFLDVAQGSPPRARGNRCLDVVVVESVGFTPVAAGHGLLGYWALTGFGFAPARAGQGSR